MKNRVYRVYECPNCFRNAVEADLKAVGRNVSVEPLPCARCNYLSSVKELKKPIKENVVYDSGKTVEIRKWTYNSN